MIRVNDTWSHGMITNFARTFLKQINVESCIVRSFRMSGGPNSNPLNGRLPPDWNRYPSTNTYPCCNTYTNPPANIGENRRPANAFGYNPNLRNTYGNTYQPYILPATHMWNNQVQYHQNSLYQHSNLTPQHYSMQPSQQAQLNFGDILPTYPSLNDRFTVLENQIDFSFAQTNPNNFGSALNSFVQDMMYVSPPAPLLQLPPPVTTLYQAQLAKNIHLADKETIAALEPVSETDDFDVANYLSPSEKELFICQDIGDEISTLNFFDLPPEQVAFKFNEDGGLQAKCPTQKPHRQWQTIRPPSNSDRSFHFSILNYNVLAQGLLESHPELYYRSEETALEWPMRWRNLTEEFQRFNCDIICLQEVQESHKELFDANFKYLGYTGLYKKRTGSKTDGCSIYYRDTMFKLLESITVEYNQPRVGILDRDNVAIIAKFLAKGNNQEIIVANTHLLFNPRRQDIRLVQMQVLLTEIDRMAFRHGADPNLSEYYPVILVGDFNSTPDSSVVDFIKSGYLNYEHLNQRTLSKENTTSPTGKVLIPPFLRITDFCQHSATDIIRDSKLSREEQLIKLPLYNSEYKKQQPVLPEDTEYQKQFSTGTLKHKFQFQTVYNHGTFDNPEGTTNQGEWITTDYIFFNRSSGIRGKDWKLSLIARYTLPTLYDLRNVAIPNYELGSDHISLVAKFSLKTPRK